MKTIIKIKENNTLTLDEGATADFLSMLSKGKLSDSSSVFYMASNNKMRFAIPMCNVLYIEFIDGE